MIKKFKYIINIHLYILKPYIRYWLPAWDTCDENFQLHVTKPFTGGAIKWFLLPIWFSKFIKPYWKI